MAQHWLTRPHTIRRLWVLLFVILAIAVAVEMLTAHEAIFGVDGSFAFNAWFGFASCVVLIAFAKVVSIFLKRRDTYYEDGP